MKIAKGVSLGPYEILAHIGAGGMGDVWRAKDQRIGREVAVKILAESYGANDERVLRFQQEARSAGALNHPGLVTIFDVGTTEGAPYIVMELLEGETLREVLGGDGPGQQLKLRKAVDYAIQIASALSVAHEKGIIHRDLKPENLFITSDGRVKILDFGLAKLAADATDNERRSGTQRHLTSAGIVVGTPGYMSPEQARAQPLDARSDIFSFGSVLYEMLSGRPAFEGFSAVETMHAVLAVDPPSLSTLNPEIPPGLEEIVRHCMEKSPRERFQSARDLAFQLRMLPEMHGTITETRRSAVIPHKRKFPVRATIAAGAVLAVLGLGYALMKTRVLESQSSPRVFKQLTSGDGIETFPSLSPDGKSFAFVSASSGNRDIYVQRVDGRIPVNITTDSPDDDSDPAFSPDGSLIAFRSERNGGGIFVMSVTGESVRRLTDAGYNPTWSPDGTRIAYSTKAVDLRPHVRPADGELWVVDIRTEVKRPLVQPRTGGPDFGRASDAVQPSWSPNGKRIAFWGVSSMPGQRDIWTIDPDAEHPKQTVVAVTSDPSLHWNPVWSPDGKYLYFGSDRDGTLNLWRIAMDEDSGKPTGAPEPLSLPAAVTGNFAFSKQGEMAYATVNRSYRLLAYPFDAATGKAGKPQSLFGNSQEILTFEPSPDGKSIAFTGGGAQEDVYVADIDGTRQRQLTFDAARDRGVTWSPDSSTLYFYSNRDGAYNIWSIRADGSGLTRVTDQRDLDRIGGKNAYLPHASPDGRKLVVQVESWAVIVHLDRPLGQRLEKIPFELEGPSWSPDGVHILAEVVKSPDIAIYSLETRELEKILDHGMKPRWLPGGRRVMFFDGENIGVYNLDTKAVTSQPFDKPPGGEVSNAARVSGDGSTLYMRQTLEQGDIWMVRFEKE